MNHEKLSSLLICPFVSIKILTKNLILARKFKQLNDYRHFTAICGTAQTSSNLDCKDSSDVIGMTRCC